MERGSHVELLALGGLYANMWALQQRSLQHSSMDGLKCSSDSEHKRDTTAM